MAVPRMDILSENVGRYKIVSGFFLFPLAILRTALITFPLYFYRFNHISFGETPILFGKTLYNLAKLPAFARLYVGFAKRFHFRQIVSDFRQIVYTFWQKNPRTKVRPLPNVKLPLKTHENNVNFRPMYCQGCRIYGLCEVSVTLSTEN